MTPQPIRHRVGCVIRRRREAMKATQEKFAKLIGMDRSYYSMIERGKKNAVLNTLEKICTGLGVRPSVILREAEDELVPKEPIPLEEQERSVT